MALLWFEGFEDGMADRRLNASYLPALSTDYGRYGGTGARVGDAHSDQVRPAVQLPGGHQREYSMGAAVRPVAGAGTTYALFGICGDPRYLYHSYGRGLALANPETRAWGVGGREGARWGDSAAWEFGIWYYVEIQFWIEAAPNGWVKMWVDGTQILDETGMDTYYWVVPDNFPVWGGTYANDFDSFDVDDCYLLNSEGAAPFNAPLGPVVVEGLAPSGNGASSQLVGSDGNSTDNYLLVDDPADEATYVVSGTAGEQDTYAFSGLSGTGDVLAVKTSTVAGKTAADAKFVQHVARSGGADYAGSSLALSQGFGLLETTWETDPSTAAAWTPAGVDAAEFGARVADA